jgi:hypothetical protein
MTSLGKRRPSRPTSDRTIIASEAKQSTPLRPPYDLWIASSLTLLAMTVQRVQEPLFR